MSLMLGSGLTSCMHEKEATGLDHTSAKAACKQEASVGSLHVSDSERNGGPSFNAHDAHLSAHCLARA